MGHINLRQVKFWQAITDGYDYACGIRYMLSVRATVAFFHKAAEIVRAPVSFDTTNYPDITNYPARIMLRTLRLLDVNTEYTI